MLLARQISQFSLFVPRSRTVWRALPIVGFATALAVLANGMYRLRAGLEQDRLWLAFVFWLLLIVSSAIPILIPARRWQSWHFFQTNGERRGWPTAILITALFVLISIGLIEYLILNPPAVAKNTFIRFGFMDKRWMVALFVLGIITIYLPGIFRRLILLASEPRPALTTPVISKSISSTAPRWSLRWSWLNALACIVVGIVLSIFYIGAQINPTPHSAGSLTQPLEGHELVVLGPLQRLHLGSTPYIGAKVHYGPGMQVVTYAAMQRTGFTLRGYRISHILLNMIACSILFATILLALGWLLGPPAIVLSLFISPIPISSFFGFGMIIRWVGPVLVAALFPLICFSQVRDSTRHVGSVLLGCTCGVLAWLAQENLTASTLTAGLIGAAAFSLERLSLRQTITTIAFFLLAQFGIFLALIVWTVGFHNLSPTLTYYFHGGSLLWNGVMQIAWSQPLSPWKIPYYLTPYIVIAITALALYGARHSADGSDLRQPQLIGFSAAAASLLPITMLLSDTSHFLGPSIPLAPLIVLTVASVPRLLFHKAEWRGVARVVLCTMFFAIYPLPNNFAEFKAVAYPNIDAAMRGLNVLQSIWIPRAQPPAGPTTFIRQRLGFTAPSNAPCCYDVDWTYGDFEQLIQQIRSSTAGRSVFVDNIPGWSFSSGIYFFADLQAAISHTDPVISLWVDGDMVHWERELRENRPDCVISSSVHLPFTKLVLEIHGNYTEQKLAAKPGPSVYCRQPADSR